ncbi:MAG: 23S rRNA (uracil1939-C5)-methyltransferase [Oceanicoccus sp.]|jgi:23S rRNA (uracil1939-C5)-methyltransferase
MKPKKGQELEVTVDRIVFGGKGIAEHEGFKIFVPDTCPGDLVKIGIGKVKKNYAEAKVLELIKPSDQRIEAKCAHFDTCGGCKFQFLSYEDQLVMKEQQVKDAVTRLGGLSGDLVKTIIGCEDPWYYRNKMELSFGPGKDGKVMLGFYPPGYHYEVFDLKECHLQTEDMAALVKKVRDWANEKGLDHHDSQRNPKGFLRNFTIREGRNTGERLVILTTSPGTFHEQDSFVDLFGYMTSVYWTTVEQQKGRKTKVTSLHLAGKPELTESLKLKNGQELTFDILPLAFFQTNTKQAEVLYSQVLELAALTGEETVFDLYCGTGSIGLFCAHAAKKIIGVEINDSAIMNARSNALRNKISNAHFYCGPVEKSLSDLEDKPDLVIVDPPRSGLGDKVVAKTAEFKAKRIVYVSCNPSTLARDLKTFAELGYTTESIQPVDMFPHTSHIECVCLLVSQ